MGRCGPALLAVLVLAVFGPGLFHDATSFDDPALVFENPVQRSFGWSELRDAFDPTVARTHYGRQYTPLSDVSYALDGKLFGRAAGPYHLQGMAFHLAAVLALFALGRALGAEARLALAAAALFAAHPLTVEAVTWISGRRTAMAGAFTLLALLAWWRARFGGSRSAYAASIALALAANLSKQSAIVTAPLLALLEWVGRAARRDASGAPERAASAPGAAGLAAVYAPHLAISLGFAALGLYVGAREGLVGPFPATAGVRAQISFAAALAYGSLIVWPAGLAPAYQTVAPEGFLDPRVLGGAALLAASLAAVPLLRRRAPLAAFGIGLGVVALLPGLHGAGTQIVADRYAYLTAAGAALALAAGLGLLAGRAPMVAAALGLAATGSLAAATADRVQDWRNDLALFGDAVANHPESVSMRLLYVRSLARAKRLPEAEHELRRAAALALRTSLRGARYLPLSLIELGGVCERRGDPGEAENAFEAALAAALADGEEIDEAAAALGAFRLRQGRLDAARAAFERGLEADPGGAPRCRAALDRLDRG